MLSIRFLPIQEKAAFWDIFQEIKNEGTWNQPQRKDRRSMFCSRSDTEPFWKVNGAVSLGFVSFNLTEDRLAFENDGNWQSGFFKIGVGTMNKSPAED
ncbi:hypothetical protein [Peribacillus simplex]|uniref:hypothetical protein n=1 Tax=Peribacillus simplex TaxID=1478 RepID=UPI003D2C09B5